MIRSPISLSVMALHGAWDVASANILWAAEKAGCDRGFPVSHNFGGSVSGMLDSWLCSCQKSTGILRPSVASDHLVSASPFSAPLARASQ